MKKLTLTLLLFLLTLCCPAQELTISGIVSSSQTNQEKLPIVAVTFFDASTDVLLGYKYTDENGTYSLTINNTPFYVKADLIGYTSYKSEVINVSENTYVLDITLDEDIAELDEVIILQKKRLIKMSGDKMTIDIDNSGLGEGNNGLETLSKLPGMRLDKDENIIFRGDGNLQILIDGKPSLLTGDALTDYLKTVSGENIKSVAIIANPSAKYDASGTGGILNIQLKKGINTGLTGNAFTSLGYAEFIKNSYGLNLYNTTEKWNINAGASFRYNESVNHRKIVQTNDAPNNKTVLEQLNDWFPITNSYTGTFGVAYKLTKNSNVGTSTSYKINKSRSETIGRTNEYYNNVYTYYTGLNTPQKGERKSLTGNVYYSYVSDSLDTKWDVQFNYAAYDNTNTKTTSNSFFDVATNEAYKEEEVIRNTNPTLFNIYSFKVDYEAKIGKNISIETGAKYSDVSNNYSIRIENRNEAGDFILDTNRSNQLRYKENISSLYGIANYTNEKWNFQAGLRSEYIDFNATSITNNQTNNEEYLSLFPSVSINRMMEDNQFKLSYSRRIRRPNYLDLNPFYDYIDTYNIEVGNPNLKPQFTQAFDFTWVHKYTTAISLYTKFTKDEMASIIRYDDTTNITTLFKDNIATSQSIGVSFNTTLKPSTWWEIQLSTDVAFNHTKSEVPNFSFDVNGSSWDTSVNQSFKFKNDWNITWNSFYSAASTYGNDRSKPSYDMSFGLRKHFLDKKLRLKLSANDVFKTNRWRSVTTQGAVTTNWNNRWETRRLSISLNYNFGNGKKKRLKSTDLQNEQQRL